MLFLLWEKLLQWFHKILKVQGGNVNLYRELLYMCIEIIPELVFFVSLIVEIFTQKNEGLVRIQGRTYLVVVYFDLY